MAEGNLQYLSTEDMNETRKVFDEQMKLYNQQKDVIKTLVEGALEHWEGDGRKAFEKDYLLLTKQLEDLHEVLLDLRKGLVDAETTFINTDAEISKSIAVSVAG